MLQAIVETSSLALPTNYDLVRFPPSGAVEDLSERYFSTFDFHSLFYDIFRNESSVQLIGPPFLNLGEILQDARFTFDGQVNVEPGSITMEELDRVSRTVVELPGRSSALWNPDRIRVDLPNLSLEATVGANHSEVFSGMDTLMTMNRDNPIGTIVDWVQINVEANAVNALLLFDNRSVSYSRKDILRALRHVEGLELAVVVNWPHPYGALSANLDSDYGQYSAWEVARWRFLQQANSVIICDVDEIMLSNDGRPVKSLAEETDSGVLYMKSRDVPAISKNLISGDHVRRHKDFVYFDESKIGPRKYCYIPERLKPQQQLKVHAVSYAHDIDDSLGYVRHFRGLHKAWRHGLSDYSVPLAAPSANHLVDERLAQLFDSLSSQQATDSGN